MSDITVDEATGAMSVDVTVTNTGQVAGKDVVQIYDNRPYTDGASKRRPRTCCPMRRRSFWSPASPRH